jgi:hypothetical protein
VPSFRELLSDLRQAEVQLVSQLEGVHNAISSLETAGASSRAIRHERRQNVDGATPTPKRRVMSAAARKAVSLRMKKYWAERRKAKAKLK